MSSDHFIFVGFERTGQVDTLIDRCEERDKVYLSDPAYLEMIQVEGRPLIGKRIKDGAAVDRIEDTARSVVSLLTRVSSDWPFGPDAALVLAVEDNGKDALLIDNENEENFDYSALVD
jgi:hypothetical protein